MIDMRTEPLRLKFLLLSDLLGFSRGVCCFPLPRLPSFHDVTRLLQLSCLGFSSTRCLALGGIFELKFLFISRTLNSLVSSEYGSNPYRVSSCVVPDRSESVFSL